MLSKWSEIKYGMIKSTVTATFTVRYAHQAIYIIIYIYLDYDNIQLEANELISEWKTNII